MFKFFKKNSRSVNDVNESYQDFSENLYKEIEFPSKSKCTQFETQSNIFDFSIREIVHKELEETELRNNPVLRKNSNEESFVSGRPMSRISLNSLPRSSSRFPVLKRDTEKNMPRNFIRIPNMIEGYGPSNQAKNFDFKSISYVLFPTVETSILINHTRLNVTAVIDLSIDQSFVDWQFLLQHHVHLSNGTKDEGMNAVQARFFAKHITINAALVLSPKVNFQSIKLNPFSFENIKKNVSPLANPNFENPTNPSVVIGLKLFERLREPVPCLFP